VVAAPPGIDSLTSETPGLPELIRLFGPLLGEDGIEQISAILADPRTAQALTTPATFVHELRETMEGFFDLRKEPEEGEIARWAVDVLQMLRDAGHELMDSEDNSAAGAGRAAYALMSRARQAAGREWVIQAVQDFSTRFSMRSVYAMAALARAASENPDGFEESVRRIASAIKEAVELWYLPVLNLVQQFYLISTGQTSPGKYLGFGEVTNFIKRTELIEVLDDRVRIIRHADAHGGIDPVVERGEVSFLNRPRKGPPEVLGPWRIDDLRQCGHSFWLRCMTMSLAMVAWAVDDVDPSVALLSAATEPKSTDPAEI